MNRRMYELLRDLGREENEEQQEAMMAECLSIISESALRNGKDKIMEELGNTDLSKSIWSLAGATLGAATMENDGNPIIAAMKEVVGGGPIELVETILKSPYCLPLMFSILVITQALMEEEADLESDRPA